jgi:ABC-type Fe3+ transport system substrate-binding protein
VLPLPVTAETLYLPNTVGVVKNCPHPDAAQKFFDFLRDPAVSKSLVDARALEGVTLDPAVAATGLVVDWDKLLRDLEPVTQETQKIFLH